MPLRRLCSEFGNVLSSRACFKCHSRSIFSYFRVSQLSGAKLQDSNSGITNLSDENRPTKLAEKFSELYDNEWTEAYEEQEEDWNNEKETIQYLYKMLLVSSIISFDTTLI